MPDDIRVPQMGESVVEAAVGKWLKKKGDPVKTGEPVLELETDKVNVEVSAAQDGVLEAIAKKEGDTVHVGDVLGTIADGDGAARRRVEPADAPVAATQPEAPHAATEAGPRVTPVARNLASQAGVDVSKVPGSGPGGRVTREDVETFVSRTGQAAPESVPGQPVDGPRQAMDAPRPPAESVRRAEGEAQPGRREERVRLSLRKQTMARRLHEAHQTAVMATTFNEIDMAAIMDTRKAWRDRFQERFNTRLGFMSFFVKAVVGALKAYPRLNSEIQGNELVYKHYYDIGMAVGTEEGLVVPVLRNADRKSFAEIEKEVADLATRARTRKLTLEELQGGTFSITNGGVFGSLMSTPILTPPQVGILGMHKIEERPVAREGQVVIRPMMYVAVTYDHRVVDGQEAVQFLVRVKELAEDPTRLLLEG